MKDMIEYWEKLRTDSLNCANIRNRSTDPAKRELFERLAIQLGLLATDLERVVTAKATDG